MSYFFYCFQCCYKSPSKSDSDSDKCAIIQDLPVVTEKEKIQPSYAFRRHSYTTGTYRPVLVQPQSSESFSTSEDESPTYERSRCYSTDSNVNNIVSLVNGFKSKEIEFFEQWSSPIKSSVRHESAQLIFDSPKLKEISELDDQQCVDDLVNEEAYRWENEDFGTLKFNTTYDPYEQKLTIFVANANQLPKKGLSYYDTCVKIIVTSALKSFHVTQPAKKSQDPIYNEEFIIYISRSKTKVIQHHYLRLSVYEYDRLGKYDAIGHVAIPMSKILEQNYQSFTSKISPMILPIKNIGQILLGLTYSKKQSRLTVNVIKGRHLKFDDARVKNSFYSTNKESYNTFVKVRFLVGGRKVRSTRSRVVLDSTDPLYRHKSSFVMPLHYVIDSSIVITVIVKNLFGRNIPLGRVITGPYTETAKGNNTQWGKMLQENKAILQWKNLYI